MKHIRSIALFALLAFALVFPLVFPNPTVTSIAIFALLYAGAATGWNIFSGYTGYISLGHSAYYGIGAYTLAFICQAWNIPGGYLPFLLFPIVGLVAGAFALPLGWLGLHLQRFTFVVMTIAILFIFQLLAGNLEGFTNGSRGMFLPLPPWSGDVYNSPFFYVALALLLSALAVSWWVRHSKYGLGLLAIRDDEERALGLGVKTRSFKLGAYVISAVFVGMAGALDAYFVGFITPPFAFAPVFDVTIALMAFFGGVGTLAGPVLGGLLLEPLQQYLTLQLGVNGLDLMLFGALLLIVILFLPEGVIPALRRRVATWRASHDNAKLASAIVETPGQKVNL